MHCTCDGRCGHHAAGHCGGRREGSGRGCEHQACTRDERCIHTKRATCCHCRNFVSFAGRVAKRPRGLIPLFTTRPHAGSFPVPLQPAYRQQSALTPLLTPSDEVLEAELCAFLHDAKLGGNLSLCEYDEWASRRQHCNLVAIVCGTRFNLHKHPVLLESRKLNQMARQVLEGNDESNYSRPGPVLELPYFPGGAEMFETLAIYCYTGEIFFSVSNFAMMNCAIEFIDMRDEIRHSVRRFLDQISRDPDGLSDVLQVIIELLAQTQKGPSFTANESIIELCMHALLEREEFFNSDAMMQLFKLPSELFAKLTQQIILTNSTVRATNFFTTEPIESWKQATLMQLHRNAQDSSLCNRFLAQQCLYVLRNECDKVVDDLKTDIMEMACEERLELTLSMTSDKTLSKFVDDNMETSGGPRLDTSVCATSDSFNFDAYTLAETFVV